MENKRFEAVYRLICKKLGPAVQATGIVIWLIACSASPDTGLGKIFTGIAFSAVLIFLGDYLRRRLGIAWKRYMKAKRRRLAA